MLELVCVSDVSEEVTICTFMLEVSRVKKHSYYIITYSLILMGYAKNLGADRNRQERTAHGLV